MMSSTIASWTAGLVLLGAATANAAPAPDSTPPVSDKEPPRCKKVPSGKRTVRLPLGPDAKLGDLLAWLSTITCQPLLLSGRISAQTKVPIAAREALSFEEAYRLALRALNRVGVTIENGGAFLRVVETAGGEAAEVNAADESAPDDPAEERFVTRVVKVERRDPHEVAEVLREFKSQHGRIEVIESTASLVITDLPAYVNLMVRVLVQF